MLLMAGAFDDDAAALGGALERAAPGSVEIVSLDTGDHGTDLLRFGDRLVADRLRQTALDFLARNLTRARVRLIAGSRCSHRASCMIATTRRKEPTWIAGRGGSLVGRWRSSS
jgi:hypothetical protein